ncbi:T9SS type A sorting domain-containing protein [Chryseobacterium sp. KACC 21268]|nr:T9SS type A sorting domain-containing protein [Chryseobacterium sp. KACC 21268]
MKNILLYAFVCISYFANAQGGCLTAVNGQQPYGTADIYCNNQFQNITTVARAGTFSTVQVHSGRTYTFKSSIATDFITLSDEAGTTVISFGTSELEYKPTSDQIIRFYVHSDNQCGSQTTLRRKTAKCDPGPDPNDPTEPVEACIESPFGSMGIDYTPFCSGFEEVISDFAYPGSYNNVQVTAGITYTFKSSESTDFLTIGNYLGTKAIAKGTGQVQWTAVADGYVRIYIHLDENCGAADFETEPRIVTIKCGDPTPPTQGCLEAPRGQYPVSAVIPACNTTVEGIAPAGQAGEYSLIQVTQNTNYTFSSSISTDLVTIGNEEGTQILSYGTGTVTWKADANKIVRFYTHANNSCSLDANTRVRTIKCGEPYVATEPNFPCFQGDGLHSNNYEQAYNISEGSSSVADDFVLSGDFTIKQLRMNIIASDETPRFSINILKDQSNSPGAILQTIENIIPTEQLIIGEKDGRFVYQVTIDLAQSITLSSGKYWLQPVAKDNYFGAFWEVTSTGTNFSKAYLKVPDENSWQALDYQTVFFIAGECATLSNEDISKSNFSFSPNPVKDILTFSSSDIENISIYNTAGQLIKEQKPSNGKLNVSFLKNGVYLFKVQLNSGKTETIKIIKE